MEKINQIINKKISREENKTIKLNNDINPISPIVSKLIFSKKTKNTNNNIKIPNYNPKYRKELIMAKIIISELQDKINTLKEEKKDIENQLNEAINTIQYIHSNYVSLTDKVDKVNQTIIVDSNNNEQKLLELKEQNDKLNEELSNKKEINKLQEEALNHKILLLTKKLENSEKELEMYKKENSEMKKIEINKNKINNENLILREDNVKLSNQYNDERKQLYKTIEEYKAIIKKLENENFILSSESKNKDIKLEKEREINSQYNNFYKNSIKEKNLDDKYTKLLTEIESYKNKNNELIEKYNKLMNEYDRLKNEHYNEKFELINEQNKYIQNLLLRIAPNPKLIEQIIDIHKEIVILEKQKLSNKLSNVLPKINKQINIFRNQLASLEDELINVDFGSSKSNIENSLSSSP